MRRVPSCFKIFFKKQKIMLFFDKFYPSINRFERFILLHLIVFPIANIIFEKIEFFLQF
jgi:hypothetical protein